MKPKPTITTSAPAAIIISKCTCTHPDQDEIYGLGMRVWNHAPSKGAKPKRYRCTVCGREKEVWSTMGITMEALN